MSYNDRGPFMPGPMKPVVDPGENVLLYDGLKYRLYQVAFIEQMPASHPMVFNGGAVVAGATLAQASTAATLDMAASSFAQLRAYCLDDIHAVLRQPQAATRWGNLNQTATLNIFSRHSKVDACGHLTETFIYYQDRLFVTITNPTRYNLAQSRIAFYGIKYGVVGATGEPIKNQNLDPIQIFDTIKQAMASGIKFCVIPTGGWRL